MNAYFFDAVGPVTQLGCADIVNTTRKRRDIYTELFFGLIISKRKMATETGENNSYLWSFKNNETVKNI